MQHLVKAVEERKMRREESPCTPLKPFWRELSTGGCFLCREWGFPVPAVEWHSWSQRMCCGSAWSVQNQHLYLCQFRSGLFLFEPLWALSALPLMLTPCPGFPGVFISPVPAATPRYPSQDPSPASQCWSSSCVPHFCSINFSVKRR